MAELSKEELVAIATRVLTERIQSLEASMVQVKEGRDADGKSSAGDKYETGREMARQEIDRLETRITESRKLQFLLGSMDKTSGNLIRYEGGYIAIGAPIGKLETPHGEVMMISKAAPLAKQLMRIKKGDSFQLGTSSYVVLNRT
jgi:hypothetical protein